MLSEYAQQSGTARNGTGNAMNHGPNLPTLGFEPGAGGQSYGLDEVGSIIE